MGCAIIASDCSGNREQVRDGIDGRMCELTGEGIRDGICGLLRDPEACRRYGEEAAKKDLVEREQLDRLLELITES